MANKKYDFKSLLEEREYWPTVLEENLKEADREIYQKRKLAVDMYLENYPLAEIKVHSGLNYSEPVRLLKRCLEYDTSGTIKGYRALVPYKRAKSYKRKSSNQEITGMVGAFTSFLEEHPDINKKLDDFTTNAGKEASPKYPSASTIHKYFLSECRKIGIKDFDYPFNTTDLGKRSIERYVQKMETKDKNGKLVRQAPDATQNHRFTGHSSSVSFPVKRPFSVVELDGHKIDCFLSIPVTTPEGDVQYKTLSRIWLLTLFDVSTRAIWGYHITTNVEYNRFDVLKCIENAIRPRKKREFTIPNLQYPENGGYPSLAIPQCQWAAFDSLKLDNAKANIAKDVSKQLTEYLKCSINLGPVATPQRRGHIERLFETLEERGYHQLVSTTGSNAKDKRRIGSEEKAVKYQITVEEIEELTEILIADYNNTPHKSLNHFTPLEVIKQRLERGLTPCYLDKKMHENFKILSFTTTRKVRGNVTSGRRPYISYEGVEYRGNLLSSSYDMVGQTLTLEVNPDDLRTITTYLEDGTEFEVIFASGKWALQPHSLQMRKEINHLVNQKHLSLSNYISPIDIYHQYIEERASTNKVSRNKLATLNRIKKDFSNSQIIQTDDSFPSNNNDNNESATVHTTPSKKEGKQVKEEEAFTQEEIKELFRNPNKLIE